MKRTHGALFVFGATLCLAGQRLAAQTLGGGNGGPDNSGFDPPVAVDLDPDPDVVEVELVAQVATWEYVPGFPTQVYCYNGSIPGPTIEGKVGDTVRVHFRNELPEETTVHWHGIETPAHMDGSHVSQPTVPPGGTFEYEFELLRDGLCWYHPHVRPFDQVERGLYGTILIRDPELEGELGFDQIEEHIVVFDDILLDANYQVVPAFAFKNDPLAHTLYQLNGREGNHLLLNGKLASTRNLTVENGKLHRWRVLNAANTTFCRLDLNADSDVPLWMIGTDSGLIDQRRIRTPVIPLIPPSPNITLADRIRTQGFFGPPDELEMSAELERSMRKKKSGAGAIDGQIDIDLVELWRSEAHNVPQADRQGIFLVPGERMDVLFFPMAGNGDTLRVFQYDWLRGRHTAEYDSAGNIILPDDPLDGRLPPQFYMNLKVKGPTPGPPYPNLPLVLRSLESLDPNDAVGTLPVTMGHSNPDPVTGNVTIFIQANFVPDGQGGVMMVPLPANKVDSFEAYDVEIGETWQWEITNLSHGDHPFHTHGFFFQPYEIEVIDTEVPQNNLKVTVTNFTFVKDTFRIPARPNNKGTSKTIIRALVKFDDTGREGQAFASGQLPTFSPSGEYTSGGWLFHCHVLEHSGIGMLSFFEVHDPDDPFRLLGKHLAGTNGNPSLTASASFAPGSTVDVELVDALPNTDVKLALGYQAALQPLAGGTLVPSLDATLKARTDAQGRATWNLAGWSALPSGTKFYLQAAFVDAGAANGFAFSNALSCELP